MKFRKFRLFSMFLLIGLVLSFFTGCDGNAVSELVDDGKIYSNVKTCIIGENYITGRFGKEFCSRFRNRTGSLNDASRSLLNNTEVVIVDAKYLNKVDFNDNLIWHVLNGRTLVITEPTALTYIGVDIMLSAFLNPDNGKITEEQLSLYSDQIKDLLNALINTLDPDSFGVKVESLEDEALNTPINDAVAMHGRNVYVVNKVDSYPRSVKETTISKTATYDPETHELISQEENTTETVPEEIPLDYSGNYIMAADMLVKWINGEKAPSYQDTARATALLLGRALSGGSVVDLNDIISAQTYSCSYTSVIPNDLKKSQGSPSTVELQVSVWTACDIDKQKDLYATKLRVIANNQQLGYKNDFTGLEGWCGPYMKDLKASIGFGEYCDTWSYFPVRDGKAQALDWSPKNQTGSTSVSTGVSFTMGKNVGLSQSGPNGGLNLTYTSSNTWSKSSTVSIPDITVSGSSSKEQSGWSYKTPDLEYGKKFVGPFKWDAYNIWCNGAKPIQIQQAVFDNWFVCAIDSDWHVSKDDTGVDCLPDAGITIAGLYGHVYHDGPFDAEKFYEKSKYCWNGNVRFRIKKPNAAKADYIMSFEPQQGDSAEHIALVTSVFKDISPDFATNTAYYAINSGLLDSSAKTYFDKSMTIFSNNANVVRDKGIHGTYKFYVQRVSSGTKVAEKELTF